MANKLPPNAGKGRPKGTPNKTTKLLKDAILEAATLKGGHEGLVGYLMDQAEAQPAAFLGLLGRVLPIQHGSDPDNPIQIITREIVRAKAAEDTDS